MKTWGILKATYLIALLHNSKENLAYLFEISTNIKYLETRTKHLLCGIREGGRVRLISYTLKRGRVPPFYYIFWIPL